MESDARNRMAGSSLRSMAHLPRLSPDDLARFDFRGLDEQAIREQWIYPLLMLLGYGLGTKNVVDIPLKLSCDQRSAALATTGSRSTTDRQCSAGACGSSRRSGLTKILSLLSTSDRRGATRPIHAFEFR